MTDFCKHCRAKVIEEDGRLIDLEWDEWKCYPHTDDAPFHEVAQLFIHPSNGAVQIDRRTAPRDDAKLNRVYEAWRTIKAYANPLRGKLPLSTTEVDAAKAAADLLMGRKRT